MNKAFLPLFLMSATLWSGQYIHNFSSERVYSLDSQLERLALRERIEFPTPLQEGTPIVLEYAAPLGEHNPDGTLKLRALLFVAKTPKAFLLGVHGLQSNAAWYAKSALELSRQGVTSLFFDRRGTGMSDAVLGTLGIPLRGHVSSRRADSLLAGPPEQAIGDPTEFLEDIHASYEVLRKVRDLQNAEASIHLYANCFGARVALAYAQSHTDPSSSIASVITTSPGTNMKKGGVLPPGERLEGENPLEQYRSVDLVDEDFTSNLQALREMGDDSLSLTLREVTNRFLLSTAGVTVKMKEVFASRKLEKLPVLVMIPSRDKIIHTEATHETFAQHYPGPSAVTWLDAEHMIEFEDTAQVDFVQLVLKWVQSSFTDVAGYSAVGSFVEGLKKQKEEGAFPTLISENLSSYRN